MLTKFWSTFLVEKVAQVRFCLRDGGFKGYIDSFNLLLLLGLMEFWVQELILKEICFLQARLSIFTKNFINQWDSQLIAWRKHILLLPGAFFQGGEGFRGGKLNRLNKDSGNFLIIFKREGQCSPILPLISSLFECYGSRVRRRRGISES